MERLDMVGGGGGGGGGGERESERQRVRERVSCGGCGRCEVCPLRGPLCERVPEHLGGTFQERATRLQNWPEIDPRLTDNLTYSCVHVLRDAIV